ncbi:MAG: DUF6288 domain-containing protein [Verrucomicrobia bacterium]|nr:DUF6288 domain-containing protein [Verrucomicrobiota bacterium]
MKTKTPPLLKNILRAMALALSIAGVCTAQSTPPDLTQPGAITAIKAKTDRPNYIYNYNLGPTGLRGWIHYDGSGSWIGKMTDASRQILVTTASTPGSAVMAVDDVILGAVAANSGTVPLFTSDARKAFGTAITDAEKTGAGTLRVKRWRAGTTDDVNIAITTLGTYSATAPYSCPKSALILANARDHMVGKLLADPDYLSTSLGHASAINALALLASVEPSHPNYAAVQTRMQTYARSLTVPANDAWTWGAAYELIFLSEYYLLTSDAQVVPVINGHTVRFAKGQGMFGTFGHGLGWLYPDGSGRMYIPPYGPVNACGNIANIAIVLGKKALQAAGQPIDPSIDAAIQRSSGFMGSHVNKGCMQYGEHFPHAGSYATNSKDASAAVFFGLQNDKAVQTEYFARMSISSWIGVELGHCGQGWGTLWGALGSGMGGDAAASGHFMQLLWRYDIHRRTDGSFTYDSDTQGNDYYGGKTADGTYLGESTDSDVKGTSLCLLTYSLPLKRLYITGKNLNTAYNHNLDATKVAHAVSAASFALDRTGKSIAQLFTDLGDYDPHVRHFASLELASRHMQNSVLTSTDLTNLRNLLNNTNPNLRGSAAQALGYLQDSTALPALIARLRDADHWVRQKAANAIRYYANTTAVSVYRDAMLEAFIANGPADPDTIDWSDPLQFSNGQLGQLLFVSTSSDGAIYPRYSIPASTANAPKETHLYPALRIALLIPESLNRSSATNFVKTYLSAADAQALFPEVVDVISYTAPGDTMFSSGPREQALQFLTNNKIKEGIPLALSILDITGNLYNDIALDALASYGDAAHYTLPTLRRYRAEWPTVDGNGVLKTSYVKLLETIQILENAVTAPPLIPGLCVANSQIVATTGAKAITLTGASPRGAFSFLNVTSPANGTLTGTAPNFTYTPNAGFTGTDKFTFQTTDALTTSDPATVAIIVGSSGTGIVGTYFNNADFTSPVLTRTDPQINFDWGTGSPAGSIGNDTFSTRWGGYLLAPETGTYSLSSLTSDGVRAYLNGVPVINNLNDQSTRWTDGQSISLTAGQKVPFFLEYYENTGSAVAKLKWTGPSFAGLNGDIIPQAYLFANISDGGADTTAPMISTLFPADNAMQAARDTVLVATFNENILPGTGNITIKNLSDGSQAVIPVTDSAHVTIFGATMVITPPTILSLGKNYAIRIANTAIQDASGNSFAGITNDTMWNFTTTDGMIISPQLITSNATSGISSTNTYTHAVNMGGGAVTINGVLFSAGGETGTGYSTTEFAGATSGNFSEFPNPGDAVATMLDPFRFGNVGQTLTVTGLTPGQMYDARIYFREWVTETNRSTLITFDADGAGLNSASTTVNGDATPQAFYLSYVFTATNEPLSVSFAGTSGNTGSSFHLSGFSVQTSGPPELTTLNPADNATDVAADANLVATFTKPIAIGIGNITLKNLTDGINTPIAVTDTTQVSISGAVLTINPTANLLPTKNYAIQIAETAIDDTAGNSFAGITTDVTWNFTTVADTAPPVISTYSPADNATGVTIDANLVATFSEPIALGTGNITIKNLTDGIDTPIAVTDTTQVSISGSVMTINLTAFLLNGKNYAIQIAATAIKDLANNSFGGINNDTTWNFTPPLPARSARRSLSPAMPLRASAAQTPTRTPSTWGAQV